MDFPWGPHNTLLQLQLLLCHASTVLTNPLSVALSSSLLSLVEVLVDACDIVRQTNHWWLCIALTTPCNKAERLQLLVDTMQLVAAVVAVHRLHDLHRDLRMTEEGAATGLLWLPIQLVLKQRGGRAGRCVRRP